MRRFASLGIALLLAAAGAGRAGAVCNVTATAIDFGNYDVFSPTSLDSTGSVTVWCDEIPPPNVVIAINPGGSGTFLPRRMRHASRPDTLGYDVFTTPAMSVVWGDGTGGTATVTMSRVQRNKPPRVATIYGRIPPAQNVSVGSYGDTLVVTIIW